MNVNVNKLVPGMTHVPVESHDGVVCGVVIVQCKKTKKIFFVYRANLYAAVNTIASALRNGNHGNKKLQAVYNDGGVKFFTFPTDTVGEAVDLRNSIIDEYAHKDIFLNIYGHAHVERVKRQVSRFPAPSRASKVKVDGVIYSSRREAALAYGFTVSTVAYRLKNPAYPDWKQL